MTVAQGDVDNDQVGGVDVSSSLLSRTRHVLWGLVCLSRGKCARHHLYGKEEVRAGGKTRDCTIVSIATLFLFVVCALPLSKIT